MFMYSYNNELHIMLINHLAEQQEVQLFETLSSLLINAVQDKLT